MMKPIEPIEEIPNEILVVVTTIGMTYEKAKSIFIQIRQGDYVVVDGEIKKIRIPHWDIDIIRMEATHILNETTNYGF